MNNPNAAYGCGVLIATAIVFGGMIWFLRGVNQKGIELKAKEVQIEAQRQAKIAADSQPAARHTCDRRNQGATKHEIVNDFSLSKNAHLLKGTNILRAIAEADKICPQQ